MSGPTPGHDAIGASPTPVGGRRWLIVNADDFGASHGVNRGVVEVARTGFLTSASLMVTEPAAEAAIDLARDLPRVSLGLHANLTGEGGPPRVDLDDPVAARRELTHQIDAFVDLVGRAPTHLDAHHNIYRHPPLTAPFVAAAADLGVPLREHGPVRYFADFYAQWDDGETHPEHVSVDSLHHMLATAIGPGITELSCHPGRYDPGFESVYHRERELELATLADPRWPTVCARLGIELVDYGRVPELVAAEERAR
jgi:predicted glycoside hydrolase/deacetylase ChbG (UPF0249 family)